MRVLDSNNPDDPDAKRISARRKGGEVRDPEATEVIEVAVYEVIDLDDTEYYLDDTEYYEVEDYDASARSYCGRWHRFAGGLDAEKIRRYLPRAAATGALLASAIGVVIATGSRGEDNVGNVAASAVPEAQDGQSLTTQLGSSTTSSRTMTSSSSASSRGKPKDVPVPSGASSTTKALNKQVPTRPAGTPAAGSRTKSATSGAPTTTTGKSTSSTGPALTISLGASIQIVPPSAAPS
ncbi:hypothetical protein ACWELQ_30050, partial [Nocardia sp. NPDC004722]